MNGNEDKWKNLSHEALLKAVHYDSESGVFYRKVSSRNIKAGDPTGHKSGKYLNIRIDNVFYSASRLAVFYMTGVPVPIGYVVDHIDHNTENNSFSNLRVISHRENIQNQIKPHSRQKRTSGYLGVTWRAERSKWRASIANAQGIQKHLGYFDIELDAYEAYLKAKRAIHKGNTL